MVNFSVVVCTYNRVELLKGALDTLVQQSINSDHFEIIVIDNNSSDKTAAEVANYQASFSNVRYFCEKKIGLSHARNRGYSEAKGTYVVYTDDDCELPVDWLLKAKTIVDRDAPMMMGGPVLAFYLNGKGKWYKDEYALLGHGDSARILTTSEFLFGGNFFIKKELLDRHVLFKPEFGMSGNTIGYSEETELQMRIRKADYNVDAYYDPALYVHHLVRPEKLRINWWIRSFIAKGKNNYYLFNADKQLSKLSVLLNSFRIVRVSMRLSRLFLIAYIFRNRKHYKRPENYIYEEMHHHFKELGCLLAGIGRK